MRVNKTKIRSCFYSNVIHFVISSEKASSQYAESNVQPTRITAGPREEIDMNGNSNRHHMTNELSTASPTEVVIPQQPQQPVVKGT